MKYYQTVAMLISTYCVTSRQYRLTIVLVIVTILRYKYSILASSSGSFDRQLFRI